MEQDYVSYFWFPRLEVVFYCFVGVQPVYVEQAYVVLNKGRGCVERHPEQSTVGILPIHTLYHFPYTGVVESRVLVARPGVYAVGFSDTHGLYHCEVAVSSVYAEFHEHFRLQGFNEPLGKASVSLPRGVRGFVDGLV